MDTSGQHVRTYTSDFWWVRELGRIADLIERYPSKINDKALDSIEQSVKKITATLVIERKKRGSHGSSTL